MDSVSDNKTKQSEELEILQAVYPDLIEMYFSPTSLFAIS